MKNQTMFSGLDHYKKQDFFDMHPYGLLMTPEENYKVDFFSGYVANVKEDAWKIGFGSDSEFELWLEKIRTRSVFESETPVAVTDRILTLSTRSYEFGNARFVLHAILSPLGRQ